MVNLDLKNTGSTAFDEKAENIEAMTKKVYNTPSLLKYGEISKLTLKGGTYFDAGTLVDDFEN